VSLFPAAALADLGRHARATYRDTVTFQANAGGRRTGEDWRDVAALSGIPASVRQVSADEEPLAGQFVGRRVYHVRFDADPAAGVTADAVAAGMRLRVHARAGFAARVAALIAPAEDVGRHGRWLRVVAVDEGAV